MKLILYFDQIQAGMGGKERPDVPLGLEKGGSGAYLSFAPMLQKAGATVLATAYCGTGYYREHAELVAGKMAGLLKKTATQALLLGPCYNYTDYAAMAADLAAHLRSAVPDCTCIVMCSKECAEQIAPWAGEIFVLEMPKKGGVGLSESFERLAACLAAIAAGEGGEALSRFAHPEK